MQLLDHFFLLVWVAALFPSGLCQDSCQVHDGKPGQAGVPGRDGWPGQKGDKGEPGLQVELSKSVLDGLKGDEGEQGLIGELGVNGYEGLLGPPGPAGPAGQTGPTAGGFGLAAESKAAFSVVRTTKEIPRTNKPVTFDKEHVNVNGDFKLPTGIFTCRVPGVYYFVFHAVSEGNLCLKLIRDGNSPEDLLFCDFNRLGALQVVSGGAVFELAKGNKVWIEPWKDTQDYNKMTTKSEMSTVFNGFLIFAKE
ncbi:complement C1q subcomponent subunit A [Brachyhypopomus gauderio]|uniref:complement C1q subcomponent subunit A n=1 Tax=Brachyhypopomus gauderio TaxID=698409 RepID=UPI0040419962